MKFWKAWPFSRQAAAFCFGMSVLVGVLGVGEVLGSAALTDTHTATGSVVGVNDGGEFFARNPTRVDVRVRIDDREREVSVERLRRPLPRVGDPYRIEYGTGPIVGLVAQQAGYRSSFARTWGVLLVGVAFLVGAISTLTVSLVRPGPPANAPLPPPGPSLADRPDWSHRRSRGRQTEDGSGR